MTPFRVPLTPAPQRLGVSLSGVQYGLTVRWCAPNGSWIMDVDDHDGNYIVRGIPLITGADLLAQLAYLGVPGRLVVQSSNDPAAVPTFDNLGDVGNLYYLSPT